MGPTLGVLLAAGQSRRFGVQNKLLHPVAGRPLVAHAAQALAGAGCDRLAAVVSAAQVACVLPPPFQSIQIEPGQDMAASFRAAIDLARQVQAQRVLISLGDMPFVPAQTFRRLLALNGDGACLCGTRRMPPVVLMAASFDTVWQNARGDAGARPFIAHLPPDALVPLSMSGALDIDTPADLSLR